MFFNSAVASLVQSEYTAAVHGDTPLIYISGCIRNKQFRIIKSYRCIDIQCVIFGRSLLSD